MNKKGALAVSQIIMLIVSIVAVSYAIGSSIGEVSGMTKAEAKAAGWVFKEDGWTKEGVPGTIRNENLHLFDTDGNLYEGGQQQPPEQSEEVTGLAIKEAIITPSATGTPTSYKPTGVKGFLEKWVAPEGWTAPKGSIVVKTGENTFVSFKSMEDYNKAKLPEGSTIVSSQTGTYGGLGHSVSGIIGGAAWAMTVYMGVKMIGPMLGLDESQTDAAAYAAGMGVFAGTSAYSILGQGGLLQISPSGSFGFLTKGGVPGLTSGYATIIGIAVALIVYYMTYKDESVEIITFECYPWDAPTGSGGCEKCCEKCNKQGILPCSEYQCRSLGQSCQLLNPGTGEEKCTWVNRKDVSPPEIKPWEDALLDDYRYELQNTGISPPDRGVKIEYTKSTTKCVKAFTPLTFGINTNEPAKCKIDYTKKDKFDDMDFFFGGSSTFKYNHSQMLSLPGPSSAAAENLTLKNNGEFELYTRCQDANGNNNTANFVFKFCVEKGPDTTPPLIVTTNLLNGMPIAYNTSSINLEVYVNEPANCKWSHLDQAYNKMEETMSCASSVLEVNAQMLYKCTTTLTGLKNREENKFYFRCEDRAEDKNVNSESYEFSLMGTQPLVIDSVGPNETIKDSTPTVKVTLEAETSAGYKEGEATCYYSDTGNDDSYIMFFETGSHVHSQELWLPEGNYKYYIKCIDLGGNADTKIAEFRVESDTRAPAIVRAYHEESYLKLITDESAECVYDTISCSYSFDDGIRLTEKDEVEHYTDWDPDVNLYVKCQDEFGNQPLPNACSIIARPFQISYGESN